MLKKMDDNTTFLLKNCPIISDHNKELISVFGFWVEGVLLCCVAILGVTINSSTIYKIRRQEEKHTFNLLLMWMLCFNSWYLFGSIIESFRKHFNLETYAHKILFPQLLYPAQNIFMSASIYLTCGITFERYIAVYHPLHYNNAVATSTASRTRMFKYLVPILSLSILLNVPKFFEAKVVWKTVSHFENSAKHSTPDHLVTEVEKATKEDDDHTFESYIHATGLRKNEAYAIYYNSWTRLIFLGILPTLVLVYFNLQIYKEIKKSHVRKFSLR